MEKCAAKGAVAILDVAATQAFLVVAPSLVTGQGLGRLLSRPTLTTGPRRSWRGNLLAWRARASREGPHQALPCAGEIEDEGLQALPLPARLSQVCKLAVKDSGHELKVQEDTFTSLTASLGLNKGRVHDGEHEQDAEDAKLPKQCPKWECQAFGRQRHL